MLVSVLFVDFFFFFFFKQKTAYEMRISDWSSDVCSSDLASSLGSGTQPARSIPTAQTIAMGTMRDRRVRNFAGRLSWARITAPSWRRRPRTSVSPAAQPGIRCRTRSGGRLPSTGVETTSQATQAGPHGTVDVDLPAQHRAHG